MPRSEEEILAELQGLLAPQVAQGGQAPTAIQPTTNPSIDFPTQPFSPEGTQTMGSSGFSQSQKLVNPEAVRQQQSLDRSGKVDDAEALLPAKAKEKLLPQQMSDTAIGKITDYDDSILATDNVIELWNQNGGFNTGPMALTNYTGTVGELARQLSGDETFSQFFSESEKMFQGYRKIVTGAQASDRELRMLRPLIAKSTDIPRIFIAKALASREIARVLQSNYVKRQGQAGRSIEGFRDITSPEDIEFAKQSYENALLSTGMDDAEAAKLVEYTFGRTSKLIHGRKTLKGTPLDLSEDSAPSVGSDFQGEEILSVKKVG